MAACTCTCLSILPPNGRRHRDPRSSNLRPQTLATIRRQVPLRQEARQRESERQIFGRLNAECMVLPPQGLRHRNPRSSDLRPQTPATIRRQVPLRQEARTRESERQIMRRLNAECVGLLHDLGRLMGLHWQHAHARALAFYHQTVGDTETHDQATCDPKHLRP